MSSWSYGFRKAPLLTDVYNYLKSGYDINKSSEVYKKHSIVQNYFTPYEQALFITPTEDFNLASSFIISLVISYLKFKY